MKKRNITYNIILILALLILIILICADMMPLTDKKAKASEFVVTDSMITAEEELIKELDSYEESSE